MKQLYALFIVLSCVTACNANQCIIQGTFYENNNSPSIIVESSFVPSYIQAMRRASNCSGNKSLAPGRRYVDISYLAQDFDGWNRRLREFGTFLACPYNYDHTPYASSPCICMVERAQKMAEEQARRQQAEERARQETQRQEQFRAEQARLEALQKKQVAEKQAALQAQYNAACDTSLEVLADIADGFEQEIDLHNEHPSAKQRCNSRIQAIRSLANNQTIYTENKVIDAALESHLTHQGLDVAAWKSCTGNVFQHVLHNEFVQIVARIVQYNIPTEIELLVLHMADIGCAYNHLAKIIKSMTLADWGWAFLDCIAASGQGISQGVQNTVYAACHPLETVINITTSIATLAYYTARYITETQQIKTLRLINHAEGERRWQHFLDNCDSAIDALADSCATMHAHDCAKGAATFVTESYLQGKLLHNLGAMIGQSKKYALTIAKDLQETMPALEHLAQTPEGLHIKVIEETFSCMAQESGKNVGAIKELVTIPEVASAVTKESAELIQKLSPYFASLDNNIATLRNMFDLTYKGFGDFANKYIKIPYKHILGIEFNIGKNGIAKLQGFHHDFMGAIEKSGLVKLSNKIMNSSGFYKADLMFNGQIIPNKTFFPQSWPQEKVISKIMEAYSNFKTAGARAYKITPKGTFEITAYTNEGIKIEIYMTLKGEINSAYPKI